jgi:hypothetical protein
MMAHPLALQLDDRDLDPPLLGLHIEDLTNVPVDHVGLRQSLIQGVTPYHRSQRGLRDLADCLLDVLDRDHRADRIFHSVVGHRRHVDADIIA